MVERNVYIRPRPEATHSAGHKLQRHSFVYPRTEHSQYMIRHDVAKVAERSHTLITRGPGGSKKKLALLLPGHNEELIIQATILSAMAAGQKKRDIYVVDDASTDKTRKMAVALLGRNNVLTVERSGKAKAVLQAIEHFNIQERYTWVHVADADSVFGKDYFNIYRRSLKGKEHVVAVGFVQSLRGNWISHYRAFAYTYSQHVIRRAQSWFGMISVFPGPITAFRTDIIKNLEFNTDTITEDFDLTIQVHRKRLGKIRFIPQAVSYTQDPQTFRDFVRQTTRWQRGFFQVFRKYKIGRHTQLIDISLGYQMLQVILYLLQLGLLVPYMIYTTGNWLILPVFLFADFFIVSILAIFSAIAIRRMTVLASLPYFYFLRWTELYVFLKAFVEVVMLGRFKTSTVGWETEGRRYELSSKALKDTAQ